MCAVFLGMVLPAAHSHARPLIADLSQHFIAIDSRFTGTRLILFGSRQAAGDIIVVVRGPARDYTLRKKERISGIWINSQSLEMHGVPDYYAIAATKPLDRILPPSLQRSLQIGIPHLSYLTLDTPSLSDEPASEQAFLNAFISAKKEKKLYADNAESITFMGDTLFKTVINFPDTLPRGDYTAEVYLVHGRQVVSMQSTPLNVAKTGFDAFIFRLAHVYPALYGILAVVVAVAAGWTASALFRKL